MADEHTDTAEHDSAKGWVEIEIIINNGNITT